MREMLRVSKFMGTKALGFLIELNDLAEQGKCIASKTRILILI